MLSKDLFERGFNIPYYLYNTIIFRAYYSKNSLHHIFNIATHVIEVDLNMEKLW